MAKLISKTYGTALFELAVEEKKVDQFLEEIIGIKEALGSNPELTNLMMHPKISKEEKIQVIENIFKNRISCELLGFLSLVITKDRCKELSTILTYFIDSVKELKGIGVAYVTTPLALQAEQKQQVERKLLDTTAYQEMEMNYLIDMTIIGGMIIRIGDRVVDGSVSTKLRELQKQLLKIQLVGQEG